MSIPGKPVFLQISSWTTGLRGCLERGWGRTLSRASGDALLRVRHYAFRGPARTCEPAAGRASGNPACNMRSSSLQQEVRFSRSLIQSVYMTTRPRDCLGPLYSISMPSWGRPLIEWYRTASCLLSNGFVGKRLWLLIAGANVRERFCQGNSYASQQTTALSASQLNCRLTLQWRYVQRNCDLRNCNHF